MAPRSPDLTMQFLRAGKAEETSVQEHTAYPEALQNETRSAIRNITQGELQQVFQKNLRRCHMYFDANGHHFEQFL
jgi:hypothetical protein